VRAELLKKLRSTVIIKVITRRELKSMQTKLRQVGGSLGATFPKDVLDQLGLREGDMLNIVLTAEGILLSPYDPDFAAFLEAAEETTAEYRDALKALA
jgi:putative addiction module antidote